MKKQLFLALTAACSLASSPIMAASPKVMATVNGVEISQARLDSMVGAVDKSDLAKVRDMARDQLIMTELLRQHAVKQGLDRTPEFKLELENVTSSILANLYIKNWVRSRPISEAMLRKHYEVLRAQMAQKEFHSRHILLESEKDALAILEELRKGRRFDELAKERSLDVGSKGQGGDLGWANPASFDAHFASAMTALERGQISAKPVKSQFGWHVIQLMNVRDVEFPPLESIRPQLTQQVQTELLQAHLDTLRKQAKIEEKK